jgi:S1-C subfamily serine protease
VASPPGAAAGSFSLWVLASNGETTPAREIWRAPDDLDLAILEVSLANTEEIPTIPIRRRDLRYGDEVFAVGNPLEFRWSLTKGTISSVRDIRFGGKSVRIFQTQTPISPGNSGGGLYASDGTLVGINTWATTEAAGERMGFSISMEAVIDALSSVPSSASWLARLLQEVRPK